MTRAPGGFISVTLNSSNTNARTDGGVFTLAEYNGWYRATGQDEYTTPGTYSWIAPYFVPSVSAVAVGGGGGGLGTTGGGNGGGGGGLGWKNNISVTPGTSYTVEVGSGGTSTTNAGTTTAGGQSYFVDASTVAGNGGGRANSAIAATLNTGGTFIGDGGGNGGLGGRNTSTAATGGGGGAGGYSGNGGAAGSEGAGSNGAGGGGGGGGYGGSADTAGAGGGVGLLGEGASGTGGTSAGADGNGGTGGSGGGDAAVGPYNPTTNRSLPGNYGGGAAGSELASTEHGDGAGGAVRIIYGLNRAFPSTNTGNL